MKLQQTKPRIGIYGVTGCAGCQLTMLFREEILTIANLVDIVAFPLGKENNDEGPIDIVFIEGLVADKRDLEQVQKLRERAKIVVALGACAVHGCTPGIKNFVDKDIENKVYEKTEHLESLDPNPIDRYIKVDFHIKGCPVDREELMYFIKQFLLGKKPYVQERSMCYICNLKENYCLLDQNIECMGPLIDGNCSIICPNFDHGCTGCRGPIKDANIYAWLELMTKYKGFDKKLMLQRLNKYAGIKFNEYMREQGLEPEDLQDNRKKMIAKTLKIIKDQIIENPVKVGIDKINNIKKSIKKEINIDNKKKKLKKK
ncbi:MAG: hypothetical protein QXG00_00700 [Candidatus Woesearchaeota archaeon]